MRKPVHLALISLLLGINSLVAADNNLFSVTVKMLNNGTEQLNIRDPMFPTNAPKEKVLAYVRESVFPKIEADAAKGKQPAVWQLGYFHLNGWGVTQDLTKAEAAFRDGPRDKLGRGLWRVGHVCLWERRDATKAGKLFLESFDLGCKGAVTDASLLARGYLFGWWKLKPDKARAETLLQKAGAAAPDNRYYLLSMAALRMEQGKYAEAYELSSRVVPKLRDNRRDFMFANSIRILSALRGGKFSEIKPEDAIKMLQSMNIGREWLLWGALAVLFPVLAGLVLWTYLTRARGPGLMLSATWIGVVTLAAGMGFMFPLPAAINTAAGRWMGAILTAAFCLISARLGGGERYFGVAPLASDIRSALRIGGLLVALLAGMLAVGFGYEHLYKAITGHPLDSQLVAAFLKCNTTGDFVITLTVAGLLIPFYEEVVFRGFLFGALERRWGGGWALGVSSVIFALIHGPTYAPVLFCIALALGWLRLRTGDLRQSILLHCLNNTLATLVLNLTKQ